MSFETHQDTVNRYRRFAVDEARGSSGTYEKLAHLVSETSDAIEFLSELPQSRRQPNLFFAAIRITTDLPEDALTLKRCLSNHGDVIKQVMLTHTTQTNEPGRCASLLPVWMTLPQPLALLEIGASAGLCLLPDYYCYDYGKGQVLRTQLSRCSPIFPCTVCSSTPVPEHLPDIAWRAGLDLNPLDVSSESEMSWLETLVWPDNPERAARLNEAIDVARSNRPVVHVGDMLNDVEVLIESAKGKGNVVVFHSAVVAYLSDSTDRDRFWKQMMHSNATWISNESPRVYSATQHLVEQSQGRFLLTVNGEPTAWTGPHGQSIEWIHG